MYHEEGILSTAKDSASGRAVAICVMRDFASYASLKCLYIIVTILEASVKYYRKSLKINGKMKASTIFSRWQSATGKQRCNRTAMKRYSDTEVC